MIALTIRIGSVKDSKPLFPEYPDLRTAQLVGFGVLEGGTVTGRTTVAFIIETPDGIRYVAESTARLLVNGMASATKGACERFGDNLEEA